MNSNFIEKYELNDRLENEMENIVFEELEKQLKKIPEEDMCKCNECIFDIACMALNGLPARYRVSLLGKLYANAIDDSLLSLVKSVVENSVNTVLDNVLEKIKQKLSGPGGSEVAHDQNRPLNHKPVNEIRAVVQ